MYLPGYSSELAWELGLLGEVTLEQAMARDTVTPERREAAACCPTTGATGHGPIGWLNLNTLREQAHPHHWYAWIGRAGHRYRDWLGYL